MSYRSTCSTPLSAEALDSRALSIRSSLKLINISRTASTSSRRSRCNASSSKNPSSPFLVLESIVVSMVCRLLFGMRRDAAVGNMRVGVFARKMRGNTTGSDQRRKHPYEERTMFSECTTSEDAHQKED